MILEAPLITLFDVENDVAAAADMLFGSNAPMLIDPSEAINWVATGSFGNTLGPKSWIHLAEETLSSEIDRASGRNDLAEEIVVAAIGSGRVRCVYDTEDAKRIPKLAYVDTAIFKDRIISHEWDGSLNIQLLRSEDDEDYICFSEFWFFWDEIQALMPGRLSGGEAVPPAPVAPSPTGPALRLLSDNRPPTASSGQISDTDKRRGRGRPAGKNGEPIAMFVLRVQAEGINKLDPLSDDALGAMLKEEYLRLGLSVPENTNAARDARGALRALVKMQAKTDTQAAE